jgi:DNA repair exonuclease SbcCD ATPase subunit
MGSPSLCGIKHLDKEDFKYINERVDELKIEENKKPLAKRKSVDALYIDAANESKEQYISGHKLLADALINSVKQLPQYNDILASKQDQKKSLKKQINDNNKAIQKINSSLNELKRPKLEKAKSNIETVFDKLGTKILSASDIINTYGKEYNITEDQVQQMAFIQNYWHDVITDNENENSPIPYGIGYNVKNKNNMTPEEQAQSDKVRYHCG